MSVCFYMVSMTKTLAICNLRYYIYLHCFDFGGSNYDSLFARTVAYPVQVAYWTKEVIAPCGYSVPCQFWPVVRRHGRGVLWAGSDPCMTGRLEYPLAWPVLAQRWSQTATDGAWYSTTALLSGRDRSQSLCVLRRSGSEVKLGGQERGVLPSEQQPPRWRAPVM